MRVAGLTNDATKVRYRQTTEEERQETTSINIRRWSGFNSSSCESAMNTSK
jgi:hypothetical protein